MSIVLFIFIHLYNCPSATIWLFVCHPVNQVRSPTSSLPSTVICLPSRQPGPLSHLISSFNCYLSAIPSTRSALPPHLFLQLLFVCHPVNQVRSPTSSLPSTVICLPSRQPGPLSHLISSFNCYLSAIPSTRSALPPHLFLQLLFVCHPVNQVRSPTSSLPSTVICLPSRQPGPLSHLISSFNCYLSAIPSTRSALPPHLFLHLLFVCHPVNQVRSPTSSLPSTVICLPSRQPGPLSHLISSFNCYLSAIPSTRSALPPHLFLQLFNSNGDSRHM